MWEKESFLESFYGVELGLSLPSTFAHISLSLTLCLPVRVFLSFLIRNDKIIFQKEACFKACSSIWDPDDTILHLGQCVSVMCSLGRYHPTSQLWEWKMAPDIARYPLLGMLPLVENHGGSPSFSFTVLNSPMEYGNWGEKRKSSPCGFSPHDLPILP